jgi:hypothetical protein
LIKKSKKYMIITKSHVDLKKHGFFLVCLFIFDFVNVIIIFRVYTLFNKIIMGIGDYYGWQN